MTILSRGTIRKRIWRYCAKHGRIVTKEGSASSCAATQCRSTKRTAYEFTLVVEHDGVKKRVRKVYPTHAEAMEGLEQFKEETRNPKPEPAPEPAVAAITLAEAFEWYFKAKARKRSLDEDQRIARHLKAEFGEQTPLAVVTASRISEYKAKRLAIEKSRRGRALSVASINRPLALLRHLLRLAHEEWEVLPAVPRIKLEKEPQGRLRWLTPEEATQLLDACRAQKNPALVDLVELALYTGMRQGELLGLTWGSVDRSRGVVLLERTKSSRRREVPLNGPADAVLARRAGDGKPEGVGVRHHELGRIQEALGDRPGGRQAGRLPLPRPAPHLRLVGHSARRDPARGEGLAGPRDAGDGDALRAPRA